jgi:hypothetical protein
MKLNACEKVLDAGHGQLLPAMASQGRSGWFCLGNRGPRVGSRSLSQRVTVGFLKVVLF